MTQELPLLDEECANLLRELNPKSWADEGWRIRYVLTCRERQLLASMTESAALREEIATLKAEATKAAEELCEIRDSYNTLLDERIWTNLRASETEAELARERERNQELRQVVKEYREMAYCGTLERGGARCTICIKADLLLAHSEPADTKEE